MTYYNILWCLILTFLILFLYFLYLIFKVKDENYEGKLSVLKNIFGSYVLVVVILLPLLPLEVIPSEGSLIGRTLSILYLLILNYLGFKYLIFFPDKLNFSKKNTRTTTSLFDPIKVNNNLIKPENKTNYPVLIVPRKATIIYYYMPNNEVNLNSEFENIPFIKSIKHYFDKDLSLSVYVKPQFSSRFLKIYDVDIAIKTIFDSSINISIGIDVPYDLETRKPADYESKEEYVSEKYYKSKYITIIFSEHQIYTQKKECLKYIAEVIFELNSHYKIPKALESVGNIKMESFWDYNHAMEWEENNYRESYIYDTNKKKFKVLEKVDKTTNTNKDDNLKLSSNCVNSDHDSAYKNLKPAENNLTVNYVKYDISHLENINSYPIVVVPKKNCVIKSYYKGGVKRRGYKEKTFQKSLDRIFKDAFLIIGNAALSTGPTTRPFEPDIAVISKCLPEIRINIEIDEPYSGYSRKPIHCIGDDENRDTYFKDRGWIIIRFTEHQIHTQEKSCLKFIAKIISYASIHYGYSLYFDSFKDLIYEDKWDVLQAQKWEKEKYRENYLNHEFGYIEEEVENVSHKISKQEIDEESLVVATSLGNISKGKDIGVNNNNKHSRDNRIKFYPDKHVYTVDGVPFPSVSSVIEKFFPEFDTYYWAKRKARSSFKSPEDVMNEWKVNGDLARNAGSFLHEQIEDYLLNNSYKQTEELPLFQSFMSVNNTMKPYRTEWKIFDETYNIAGTIDFISYNGHDGYNMFDWKRSKKVIDNNGNPITVNNYQQGIGNLSHIDDTSYNRYCLQQSIYCMILENNYNIQIKNMYLIILHPNYSKYYKLKVPYMKKEAEYILSSI